MRAFFCGLLFLAAPSIVDAQDACLGGARPRPGASVEERYRAAQADYEAGRTAVAAATLRALALDHADHAIGADAASLYLDSVNQLLRAGNQACADTLAASIEPLTARYCGAQPREELCRVLAQFACDTERVRADALARVRRYDEAARALTALAREHPSCGRLDEVLFNAALYWDAAGQRGRAIRMRTILLSNFPQSRLAPRASFLVAGDQHALANYGQAAAAYENFARRYPTEVGESCSEAQRAHGTCPDARAALANAAFFRIGLGDFEAAREDVRLYERNYARRDPERTRAQALGYAGALEHAERWTELRDESERLLRTYGGDSPELAIHAHRLAARACRELGEPRAAAPHLDAIARGYREVAEALERDAAATDAALRRVRVLDAAAEALFLRTDAQAEALLAAHAPSPSGDLTRWSETTLAPWIARQSEAIRAPIAELERIALLEIPGWQIAAAERVAALEAHLVDEIEAVAESFPEDARSAVRRSIQPTRDRALEHYEFCAAMAVRVRWPSEPAARCHEALTRLDPARHPPGPSELLGPHRADRMPAHPVPALDPTLADSAGE